jgi:hypothetical protein
MAEKEGFEPSMGFKAHTPLAGERLRPLGHLSANTACALLHLPTRLGLIGIKWCAWEESNLRPPGS